MARAVLNQPTVPFGRNSTVCFLPFLAQAFCVRGAASDASLLFATSRSAMHRGGLMAGAVPPNTTTILLLSGTGWCEENRRSCSSEGGRGSRLRLTCCRRLMMHSFNCPPPQICISISWWGLHRSRLCNACMYVLRRSGVLLFDFVFCRRFRGRGVDYASQVFNPGPEQK